MQALQKRHIKPGQEYDKLFPKSAKQDTVIKEAGKAKLHHTINLIRDLVWETKEDTKLLAQLLKGKYLKETCRNIWEFVYSHINYHRDKTGIEQVRRPSRTWADRKKGVDCDCYTVFISSILTNLGIPHSIRITKYNGKRYFQHIYPVVSTEACATAKTDNTQLTVGPSPDGKFNKASLTPTNVISGQWSAPPGYITIDCVTDHFDYEVPFSDYRDFDMQRGKQVGEIHGLSAIIVSGVDSADLIDDLGIFSLQQPKLPLRKIVKQKTGTSGKSNTVPCRLIIKTVSKRKDTSKTPKLFISKFNAPVEVSREKDQPEPSMTMTEQNNYALRSSSGFWIKLLLAAGIGYGTYKLLEIEH